MSKVAFPITIVDYIDIGLDLENIQNKLQSYYDEYEDDLYLLHKNKINYISKFTKINNDEIYKNINFDFSQSCILFEILKPLKEECISVLVVSAYERDYIFVNKNDFDKVKKIFGL